MRIINNDEYCIYVWCNSMNLLGRFYGGVSLVHALICEFKRWRLLCPFNNYSSLGRVE